MMNDTTNQTNPIDDLHITMEDGPTQTNETPLPLKELVLLGDLMRILTRHVETLVDQRFAALVESHKTLALMDENMRDAITEMIDDKIGEHEYDKDHKNDADIESEVGSHVEYFLRQGDHQFVTERELSEKVSDVLDEILSDRINDALSNASIEISI